MDVITMVHLIKVTDELERLDERLKNLTGMGYHERFPRLAYVYDVIKQGSVFRDIDDDDIVIQLYELVENSVMTPEERAKKLIGIDY